MTADEIIRAILSDRQLLKIKDKIQSGKGTFEDTAKYSNRASELLGKYFSESVLDISEQERVEACTKLLNNRYDDINTLLDATQRSIDSKSNLQIKPQHAGFDIDRAVQIGESLIDKTVPDSTIVRRAGSAPVTMSRSMHDDYIKANAEFRSRAGLKCYITRVSDNEPCKWCTRLAGRYGYGQEPDDVYRRHDNCGCTVTYENGRERQNVWTKNKWTVPDKEAGAEPPKVFSKEEAQRLNNEHTSGFVNKMSIDNSEKNGIIETEVKQEMNLVIDKFTPCLEDTETGELVPTVYEKATKKELSELQGWNFNWLDKDLKDSEIYKLCIVGDNNIQGLVAITDYQKDMAVYVNIAESAPHNLGKGKKYSGVGGHLFAIAAKISYDKGYGGFLFMDAKNTELVEHYRNTLGAVLIGRPHPYRMFVDEENAIKLLNTYTFEEG